jgi:hypothetical protein
MPSLANGDGSIFNLSSIAGIIFRFANDSPLEGDGFELSVPGQRRHPSATANHTKVGDT